MHLDSAQSLKQQLMGSLVTPFATRADAVARAGPRAITASAAVHSMLGAAASFGIGAGPLEKTSGVHRSIALGVAPHGRNEFRLAVRLQRSALRNSDLVERIRKEAKGEVDLRIVGRIDKRATAAASGVPWHQRKTDPMTMGASIGHWRVTAGTIGAFVRRAGTVYVLSNNHVLANEDRGAAGDAIVQPGTLDGGRRPADVVAKLRRWVRFKKSASNHVDVALAALNAGIEYDATLLRAIAGKRHRHLVGLGPEFLDEGVVVYKVGRTTGATKGRVTAFDLDNLVVRFDIGNLRFDNQIEIEGTGTRAFSDGGDSGSLIVDAEMRAVALLFAGSDTGGRNDMGLTFAAPIHKVLSAVNATLLL